MTPLGWSVLVIILVIGVGLGLYLSKRYPNLLDKILNRSDEKKIKEVIENPHLLVEKLKSHGEIYDMGKKLDVKVGIDKETGKEVVVVEETEVKVPKEIKKKIEDAGKTKKVKKKEKIKFPYKKKKYKKGAKK